MNLIISVIIGAVVAYITKLLLEYIGIPAPFPVLAALLMFLFVVFGAPHIRGGTWR